MVASSTVFCIGELLIDFFCTDVDVNLTEGKNFVKQAGGAPANVCAAIARLGGHAQFAGKVGNDPFGQFLKKTLEDVRVDTSMLILDDSHPTTQAFVSLKADGERDFIFNRGADAFVTEEELNKEVIMRNSILHFGSATALLQEPFKSTYVNLMLEAKKENKFVSFDPNYRHDLWKGRVKDFIDITKKCIGLADFVKMSDEELKIISGAKDVKEGISLLHLMGAKVVAVTLGANGTIVSNGKKSELVPSIRITSIDSTGAGDAFVGATLFQLSRVIDPQTLVEDFEELKRVIYFSNKVGAFVCTKVGAISTLPTEKDVSFFVGQ
ncbi:sugar kinase [Bacillus sp. FJAT-18017]|uniref:carbohydrate kinase family protein n=1 Tax=Bacillus sp. FJAT-18017 TaxID=1705566 RepID=UPI0006B0680E|nr:carbohydrate kinase [Bacillus sp. FJAT-18017]ALC91599.1 sugar kinase [Bacillus sp. FJAT-18017]